MEQSVGFFLLYGKIFLYLWILQKHDLSFTYLFEIMKFKKDIALILILFLLPIIIVSQTKRSDRNWLFTPSDAYSEYDKRIEFSKEVVDQLKKTKTVFFLKITKKDSFLIDSFRQALKKSWDLTDIIYEDIKNIEKYAESYDYSYILLGSQYLDKYGKNGPWGNYYLTLSMNIPKKSSPLVFAKIDISPNDYLTASIKERSQGGFFNFTDHTSDVYIEIYNGVRKKWIPNFTPVSLMAQFGVVSENIKNGFRPKHNEESQVEDLQQRLSKDTLYIPRRMLKAFKTKGFQFEEIELDEEVLSEYKYPYKICNDKELYKYFVKENRGRYLFEFTQTGREKNIFIIDVKEKKYIYKSYQANRLNPSLNEKDFKNICKR